MSENHNLEAERAAPCPLCQTDQVQICRDSNNPVKDAARCRECKCTAPLAIWNQRRAPAVGEDGLPPLPEPLDEVRAMFRGEMDYARPGDDYYTAKQVRQAQRDAVAADRAARVQSNQVVEKFHEVEQPASAAHGVKTWLERYEEDGHAHGGEKYMEDEIRDLRAQLACQSQEGQSQKPCRREIIASGAKAWPRSCLRCGLGPCQTNTPDPFKEKSCG